jgi:hypothetical protein
MTCHVLPPDNIEELVAQYVRLRDKLKESDDAHKEKTKSAREYLELLNAKLLERLNDVGGESVKTAAGTVYRTTKRSATLADGDLFRNFVRSMELFDLVDWRANPTAVAEYVEENQVPPPGVNYSTTFTVGVRRK